MNWMTECGAEESGSRLPLLVIFPCHWTIPCGTDCASPHSGQFAWEWVMLIVPNIQRQRHRLYDVFFQNPWRRIFQPANICVVSHPNIIAGFSQHKCWGNLRSIEDPLHHVGFQPMLQKNWHLGRVSLFLTSCKSAVNPPNI
mgnify:CR=1 FL=1